MKAKYLGLELASPVIVSSSPYTASVQNIERCVREGAGAVVLKSIFEEQILREAASLDRMEGYGDAGEYLERYLGDAYKGEFLQLVQGAAATGVPAIASINCIGAGDAWIEYAEAMQAAGAAALELNVFLLPTDRHAGAQELEQAYADIVRKVAAAVTVPVSVKLPMRLTNVLSVGDALLARGARGVVLYNRFFEPDIDVEKMCFVAGDPFSEPSELRNVLRSPCAAAARRGRFDGRARRRGCREGAAVRRFGGAGLHGDPPLRLRGDFADRPFHRRVGRSSGLRLARRVPRADGLRVGRGRPLPARAVHEVFSPRGGVTVSGPARHPRDLGVSGRSGFPAKDGGRRCREAILRRIFRIRAVGCGGYRASAASPASVRSGVPPAGPDVSASKIASKRRRSRSPSRIASRSSASRRALSDSGSQRRR